MLRKYTRANSKLFGLRFHQPLFSLRTSSSWELEATVLSSDTTERALVDESHCAHKLERIARDKLAGKVRYQLHVVSGTPDDDVVRMANEIGADLIVMATHGRKGLSHFILGSVAERVMREADCPVLTMRTKVKSA
jgi:nucleotide-binding universal stress UspA family protein